MEYAYICTECGRQVFSKHKETRCSNCSGRVPLSRGRILKLLANTMQSISKKAKEKKFFPLEMKEWNAVMKVLIIDIRHKAQLNDATDSVLKKLDLMLNKIERNNVLFRDEEEIIFSYFLDTPPPLFHHHPKGGKGESL